MRKLILLLFLVVLACGGGDVNLSGDLSVSAVEFEFIPDAGLVGAGDTEVTFTNAGSIVHEFSVLSSAIESEGDFSEDLVLFRLEAAAGAEASGTLNLDPGTYQVVCAIQGHFSAGMEATLQVVDN